MRRPALIVAAALLAGCPANKKEQPRATSAQPGDGPAFDPEEPEPKAEDSDDAPFVDEEAKHHVVFADRTTQAYLLLVDGDDKPAPPTRDALVKLVRDKMPAAKYEAELALLEKLVRAEPPPPGFAGVPEDQKARLLKEDLLGLHIDVLPVRTEGEEPLISREILLEPVLSRELTPEERAEAAGRRWAVLLRAEYRNQYAVRGLRLLQTLVRVYATEEKAFIHDPDTSETLDVEAFTRRRLQASVGNIADQLAVVPFPQAGGLMRMTTRGMRRFGSVDLELAGLPRDPKVLDRATFLLVGLAHKMVRLGEYSPQGFAVEVDDEISLTREDIIAAYAGRPGKLPPCDACDGEVAVHLVERDALPTDPHEHVVARVVAPRETSDAAGYKHGAWVETAIADLLGGG